MSNPTIRYIPFDPMESQLPQIKALVEGDLSEPYSIFCYRYFLHSFPQLCHVACDGDRVVGVVIGRIITHRDRLRGYIGMLAVHRDYRRCGIALELVSRIIASLKSEKVDEIVLEAEQSNTAALNLYRKFGFIRDKLLVNYYLNGSNAFRLKLFLR